jgi:hypothetical protein
VNFLMLRRKSIFFLTTLCAIFLTTSLRGENNSAELLSWSSKTIGNSAAQATFTVSSGEFRVSAPSDPRATNAIHFVFQRFSDNGQITARLAGPSKIDAKSGVMIRENLAEDSRFAWMAAMPKKIPIPIFERRPDPSQKVVSTIETNAAPSRWLRLVKEGNAVSGFYSSDGTNWVQSSADTIEMGTDVFSGLAVVGKDAAVFDNIQLASAHLASPSENSDFVLPTNVLIKAKIACSGTTPRRVEFFADARKIGETTNAPYAISWSNALAGPRSLIAKIIDNSGAEFFTEPVNCEIKLPPAQVRFTGVDNETRGDWQKKYGAEGYCIIRHATNFPAYAEVSSSGQRSIVMAYSGLPDALKLTNGTGGITAQWFTYTNMTVNISLLDGRTHRVAFYLHDSDSDLRVQQIKVIDAATQNVIDTRNVAKFHTGKYYVWEIRGAVRFKITQVAGNAVINGLFFDAQTDPLVKPE